MPRVRNAQMMKHQAASLVIVEDEKLGAHLSRDDARHTQRSPSPSTEMFQSSVSISLPTLDSIPQSARHQRRAALKYSLSGSTSTAGHVPRPRNAYVLYRSWALSYHPSLVGSRTTNKQDVLSRMTGELWNAESDEVRAHFANLAAEEKERHAGKYPGYTYMPKQQEDGPSTTRQRSGRNARRGGRKKHDDDDDYMPNTHSRSAAASSHRYTPYASVPSIPANPLDELDFTPSTSTMSLEEYQFLMASVTGSTSKGVVDADAFCSSPVSYPTFLVERSAIPASPSALSSVSLDSSQNALFLSSPAEEEAKQTITYPTSQPSSLSTTTYIPAKELSSLLSENQRIDDLFSQFTVDEPILCSDAPSMDINDILSPLLESVADDDVFHDMMDAYTTL